VVAFLGAAAGVMVYFFSGTEVRVPIVEPSGYHAVVKLKDVDNIVAASQVRMAGVDIGEVRGTTLEPDGVRVEIAITNKDVSPLHEGVTVRVGARSVVEDNYLDIVDGDGAALPEGSTITPSHVQRSTQLDDVLRSLDPQTRNDLGSFLRSVGKGTAGTQQDVDSVMAGLGALGREGHTALDAIAAQSEDLRSLSGQTQILLKALDAGEGDILNLVTNGQRLTRATAGQNQAIEASMRSLPGVLDSAQSASGTIEDLSSALTPVAANLKDASPYLNTALNQLPSTTRDLHGLLQPLDRTLGLLPATLDREPAFGADVRNTIPGAQSMLRDANPMLAYLKPYGPELAAFFANFNSVLQYRDEAGIHYARLLPHINEQSVQSPLKLEALGTYYNPLPGPGTGGRPGPFRGDYPRVVRDPG
jgi:phospholipid/cholesterol/gamma-HCH transport system substrate-binding protein